MHVQNALNIHHHQRVKLAKLAIGTSLLVLILAFFAALSPPAAPISTIIDNTHWTICYFAGLLLAWIALKEAPSNVRPTLRWFLFAMLSLFLGQLTWDIEVWMDWIPFPAPSDLFFLGFGACLLVGVGQSVFRTLPKLNAMIVVMDTIIIASSALALTLLLYIPNSEHIPPLQLATLVAYPVLLLTAAIFGFLACIHMRIKINAFMVLSIVSMLTEGFIWMHWNQLWLSHATHDLDWFNLTFSVIAPILGLSFLNWRHIPSEHAGYIKWCNLWMRTMPIIGIAIATVSTILLPSLLQDHYPKETVFIGTVLILLLGFIRQSLQVSEHEQVLSLERKALESKNLLHTVLDKAPVRIFWKDRNFQYLGSNLSFAQDAGFDNPMQLVGKSDFELVWKQYAQQYREDDERIINTGVAKLSFDEPIMLADGGQAWLRTSKVPLRKADDEIIGVIGFFEDITEYKQTQFRENVRNLTFEMLNKKASVSDTLTALALSMEAFKFNTKCSILMTDRDRHYLYNVASPSLPTAICALLNRLEISPNNGSCGAAAYYAKRVIAEDVNVHPNWVPYKQIAMQNGIAACWSEPIISAEGEVLGTFALYHPTSFSPTPADIALIEHMATLCEFIITSNQANEDLKLASMMFESSREGMLVTDIHNKIVTINPAFTAMTGYSLEDVKGKDPKLLKSNLHDKDFYNDMWHELSANGHWYGEIWNRRKNGEIFPLWNSINTIFNADGTVHSRIAIYADISEKKRNEELIWQQANFDTLTGLPNRRMFNERLAIEMKKSKRDHQRLALMFLDLDRFKEVNDTLGHDVGDQLLRQAANRIQQCVREIDTVARLGGDEFTVLLGNIDDLASIGRVAHSILEALSMPFQLGMETAYISTSIGVTLYPDDALDAATLLKNADQAMYAAKHQGRNRFNYFTPAMQEAAHLRMRIANDLRHALSDKQFELYYQPIVELETGRIFKAEALIRWVHPEKGMVSPADFIPIAEETGMIIEIGDWVLQEALKQVLYLREHVDPEFQISINKSPVQFLNKGASCRNWVEELKRLKLPGKAISVEITEGLLLDTSTAVTNQLLEFRDHGVQVSIDDFGTGHSSMSYLKKFDVDYLKIDQSFVRNLAENNSDMALCEAIVVMAHKLGMQVIAEGIEHKHQRDLLRSIGCNFGQGYWWSKPLNKDDFDRYISTYRP